MVSTQSLTYPQCINTRWKYTTNWGMSPHKIAYISLVFNTPISYEENDRHRVASIWQQFHSLKRGKLQKILMEWILIIIPERFRKTSTCFRGRKMFDPPFARKLCLIHSVAFIITSLVGNSIDDENRWNSSLKATILKRSSTPSFERDSSSASVTFSRGFPRMLPLISITNTTSFLNAYKVQNALSKKTYAWL